MGHEVVITGIALVTPVGLRTGQTCASVRAGISRFEELSWRNEAYSPIVMATVPDNCLPGVPAEFKDDQSLTFREKRIIQIAELATGELREAGLNDNIPFILGLPQADENKPINAGKILKTIASRMGLNINQALSRSISKGRASGLMAIYHACSLIQSGQADYVLTGGCDSYKDIEILGFLNVMNRLKSEICLDGFIPGEGAGFLLLASEIAAKRNHQDIYGKIAATAIGHEPGHLYSGEPYKGDGLFQTFQTLFGDVCNSMEKIRTVYSGMNGESHWIKEWGVSQIRFADKFEEGFQFGHPADCYGDIGAASGPVMIALALNGMKKKYVNGPILVYASSDQGDRAIVIPELFE